MHALILMTLAPAFAPAPVYKPEMTEQQEAMLKEAEEEIWVAAVERKLESRCCGLGPKPKRPFKETNRAAAEKLSRLHAGLSSRAHVRVRVAMKAAEAWENAGEGASALHFYRDAAERARTWEEEGKALMKVRDCYVQLGKPDKAREAQERAFKAVQRCPDGIQLPPWTKRRLIPTPQAELKRLME